VAKHNVIIVGNGLFGSIAATLARAHGHSVTVVSNNEANAASLASGCVLAPSWLSSLGKDTAEAAMAVLAQLYTVHPVVFQTNMIKSFKASRVDPADILVPADIVGKVVAVGNGWVDVETSPDFKPDRLKGKVLIAAGVWSGSLATMPTIRGLWGASVRVRAQLAEPRISVYAPYRQAVAFNMTKKEVWMGDGTALIEQTWRKESAQRIETTLGRAVDLFGLPVAGKKVFVGARPYVEGHKAGFFEKVHPNTWVSTGGAKNGTVLAAWQAERFVRQLNGR